MEYLTYWKVMLIKIMTQYQTIWILILITMVSLIAMRPRSYITTVIGMAWMTDLILISI